MPPVRPPKKPRPKSEVSCVIKYLVFGFNVFFWIIGAVIIGIGIWAWTEKGTFSNFGEITGTAWLDPVLLILIIGAIVFIIGFFGCIGALRENTILLLLFVIFVGLILVCELGLGVLAFAYKGWYMVCLTVVFMLYMALTIFLIMRRVEYSIKLGVMLFLQLAVGVFLFVQREWFKTQIGTQLQVMITAYRDDADLQNLIDWMQKDWLKCCGIVNYDDWDQNIYFNCTSPSVEKCGVPFSCCLPDETTTLVNTQCGYDTRDGALTADPGTKIYTTGCVDAGEAWLNSNLIPVAGAAVGIALLQVVTIILGCMLRGGVQRDQEQNLYA